MREQDNENVRGNGLKKRKQRVRVRSAIRKKLVVFLGIILLAFAWLMGRVFFIMKESGTEYQKQIYSQQKYDSSTIPYKRGAIVDANGMNLAVSEKVYNLIIDAKVMNDKKEYLEPTLAALDKHFDLDMQKIRDHVTTNSNSAYYIALKRLSYEDKLGFELEREENSNIKGVWFEEEYKRVYPNGSLAADVIGFANAQNVGSYGLEEYYNDVLNGIPGRSYGYLSEDETLRRTIKEAVNGNTIHSTIDINIQNIIERQLKAFNDTYKNSYRKGNGAENVGCIVMEVDTGRILGMASYPTFDLNDTRNGNSLLGSYLVEEVVNAAGYTEVHKTKTVIDEEVLAGLTEEQLYTNLHALWKNFCITQTYEPGSTAKPFTAAAALESGAINKNTVFVCNGNLEIGGHTIKCHNVYGDGNVTVRDAIAWSCNVALMKMGQALGAETFSEYQSLFNFGLKTNVDLAGEARTDTLIYKAEDMKSADLATNTFGQNFNTTMIQVLTGYCALINGGYYYEPHMVDKISNAEGAVVKTIEPRLLKQVISEDTSELIRSYCNAVVMKENDSRITGRTARPAGYAIGGKTGTAQTIPRGNGEYVVSFIGHAPADNPEIAVYVVVDRANASKQDDAKYATRIVRGVLTEVLPYLNIYMTEELSEKEKQELEALNLENTNHYNTKPEEEELDKLEEEPEETDTEEAVNTVPVWMTFPIDEETGHRKDPNTGALIDADTGDPITGRIDPISE
ncbi:MAG: penicillin-binding protein 2 [Lachnospiraceae bacterium]|nr:penicillin-binding protein 2 [Lachnospiraceae bacterium]